MARNIPLVFVKHQWDVDNNEFVVEPNPDFISRVKGLCAPTDTLLVMCRGGVAPRRSTHLPNQGLRTSATSSTDGRRQGRRHWKRKLRKADEERLEECRIALDLRC